MENIPDTPEGIILESLLEGMNQYFSTELAQKVSRGMKETRRKGYFQGGALLYGYKLDGRKIVADEVASEVVRYIYEQYSKGVYVKDIIAALTAKGIMRNGAPFATNSIYNILRNEKYSGVYMHGDEVVDNMYPQIVPREIYDIVRAKIDKNKYGRKCVKVDFLLRQKLICGYCGHSVNGESGTSHTGAVAYYYKCRGRKKHLADCHKTMMRKEELETLVLDAVIQALTEKNTMKAIVSGLLAVQENLITASSDLYFLEKQKKQVETALNNLVAAIERGILSNATNQRLHDLEKQQEELERKILVERSKTVVKLNEDDIRAFYEQALRLEPKLLINFLIKEIVLYDDHIDIYFNSPIRTSPDDNSQGFSFYSKTVLLHGERIDIKMIA